MPWFSTVLAYPPLILGIMSSVNCACFHELSLIIIHMSPGNLVWKAAHCKLILHKNKSSATVAHWRGRGAGVGCLTAFQLAGLQTEASWATAETEQLTNFCRYWQELSKSQRFMYSWSDAYSVCGQNFGYFGQKLTKEDTIDTNDLKCACSVNLVLIRKTRVCHQQKCAK